MMVAQTPLFQPPTDPVATFAVDPDAVTEHTLVAALDVRVALLVERQLDRIAVDAVNDVAPIEAHLRLVERVVAEAEEMLGKPVGMAVTPVERRAEKVVTDLYLYRRLVRSRRGELMDRVRQEGSSPRQRALRRLAEMHPVQYRVLVREEREKAAQAS